MFLHLKSLNFSLKFSMGSICSLDELCTDIENVVGCCYHYTANYQNMFMFIFFPTDNFLFDKSFESISFIFVCFSYITPFSFLSPVFLFPCLFGVDLLHDTDSCNGSDGESVSFCDLHDSLPFLFDIVPVFCKICFD